MIFEGDLKEGRERLAGLVASADRLVPFTGAGLSTECGIPDFRSPNGLWSLNKPIHFEEFVASPQARREAWRRRFAMEASFAGARPGRGHRAIARWVEEGRSPGVITQNVDNLHQESGIAVDKLVELHGNTTFATCLSCGTRHELGWIRTRFEAEGDAPPCRACGGIVKTATVSFGQAMPQVAMRRAKALAATCDLFLAIGSSLIVYPAAGLPALAKERGAWLVIVNREPTPLDEAADLILRGEIGDILNDYVQT
jgi:NAD-dependent deacetylase